MQCEVCGRSIEGKPYKAMIEGARMVVCGDCAALGSVRWEATPPPKRAVKGIIRPKLKVPVRGRKPVLVQTLELVEDFGLRVRQAREGLGLSREDFGRKIGEKVSVLRRVEGGRMPPDHRLARKLEHALGVKLLVPFSEPKVPPRIPAIPRKATLGEIARIKRGNKEASEERGRS